MKFERTITAAGCAERGWLDLTGSAVSWVCLIHCLALPFLISLLPLAGLSFLLDERIEWGIMGVSVAVGTLSFLHGYFQWHGKALSLLLFVSGISLITLSHLAFEEQPKMQIPFMLAGAGLITAAHLVNRHLCYVCTASANANPPIGRIRLLIAVKRSFK